MEPGTPSPQPVDPGEYNELKAAYSEMKETAKQLAGELAEIKQEKEKSESAVEEAKALNAWIENVIAGMSKGSQASDSQLQGIARETASSLRRVADQEVEIRRLRQLNDSGLRERLILNRRLQDANEQIYNLTGLLGQKESEEIIAASPISSARESGPISTVTGAEPNTPAIGQEGERNVDTPASIKQLEADLAQARTTIREKTLEIRRLDATITNLTRSNHTISNMLNKYVKRVHNSAIATDIPILQGANSKTNDSSAETPLAVPTEIDELASGEVRVNTPTEKQEEQDPQGSDTELAGNQLPSPTSEEARQIVETNTVTNSVELNQLRADVDFLTDKLKEKETALSRSQLTVQELETRQVELEKKNTELSTSYLECRLLLESKETAIQELGQRLDEGPSRVDVEELATKHAETEEQLVEARRKFDEECTRRSELERDYENAQAALQEARSMLQQEKDSRAESQASHEAVTCALNEKIRMLEVDAAKQVQLQEESASLHAQSCESEAELRDSLSKLREELAASKDEVESHKCSQQLALQEREDSIKAATAPLSAEIERLTHRVEQLESENSDTKRMHTEALANLEEDKDSQAKAVETLADLSQNNKRLLREKEELQSRLDEWNHTSGKELQTLRLDLKEAHETERQLREQLVEAEQALEAANIRQLWRKLAILEEALEKERGTTQLMKDKHSNKENTSKEKASET
mmetsp:Transcript_2321/g.8292  ORF Transcript_2321/g.8292 Transcript_2321/m.8292 type:complete len:706 (+) Transcript_2321:108-2225(+)